MHRSAPWVAVAALAFATSACPPPAKSGDSHPLARNLAPEISVQVGGKEWSPASAKGKVLIMDFWATWCVPCKESFPHLDAIYRKYKDKGLQVVGVTGDDDKALVDKFVKDTKVTFPIGYDASSKGTETYKVDKMPTSFVIDRKGVIRYPHGGYTSDDAAQIEKEVQELLAEEP